MVSSQQPVWTRSLDPQVRDVIIVLCDDEISSPLSVARRDGPWLPVRSHRLRQLSAFFTPLRPSRSKGLSRPLRKVWARAGRAISKAKVSRSNTVGPTAGTIG